MSDVPVLSEKDIQQDAVPLNLSHRGKVEKGLRPPTLNMEPGCARVRGRNCERNSRLPARASPPPCPRDISHSPPWLFFAVKYLWPSTVPLLWPFGSLSSTPILGLFFSWCEPTNLTTPVPCKWCTKHAWYQACKWCDFGRASALNQHQQYVLENPRRCVAVWLCVCLTVEC